MSDIRAHTARVLDNRGCRERRWNRSRRCCVQTHIDTDNLDDAAALPPAVEAYLAQERSWWRLLRATGAMTEAESVATWIRRGGGRAVARLAPYVEGTPMGCGKPVGFRNSIHFSKHQR